MSSESGVLAAAFLERSRYYLGVEYPAKIRAALLAMPRERVWWRPNAHSNSAGNLVLHLAGNARQWVVSGIGGAPDIRQRDGEFAAREGQTAEALLRHLDETVSEVDRTLARLREEELPLPRSIQGRATTVFAALYHVVEHFSGHTGQIVWLGKMWSDPSAVRFYDDANNAAPLFLDPGVSDI